MFRICCEDIYDPLFLSWEAVVSCVSVARSESIHDCKYSNSFRPLMVTGFLILQILPLPPV